MKKTWVLVGVFLFLLTASGLVIVFLVGGKKTATPPKAEEEPIEETIAPADGSIVLSVKESKVKDNTVSMAVTGLSGKYTELEYELTYESEGLIKGVNSGSKPVDISGKDRFEREVYLGTCSRNVCKPDTGVTKVTVTMTFADANAKKSQLTKEQEL